MYACGWGQARHTLEAAIGAQFVAVEQEHHQHDDEEGDQRQGERGAQLVKEAEAMADDAFGGHD